MRSAHETEELGSGEVGYAPEVISEGERLPRAQGWSFALALSLTLWALIILAVVLLFRA